MIAKLTPKVFRTISTPQIKYLGKYTFTQQRPKTQIQHNDHDSLMSTNHRISKNIGLNRFLRKTYTTAGLSILAALDVSYAVLAFPIPGITMGQLATGGLLTACAGFIGSLCISPTYVVKQEHLNSKEITKTIVAENSFIRQALYITGIMGLGVCAAPLLGITETFCPGFIPIALGLTAAIFGGASLAAICMPKDKMLGYGRALTGSLVGLIGLHMLGLGASYFMGPNIISLTLASYQSYLFVGLSTAIVAYDTHAAIKMYEQKQPDHLLVSVHFILDFWNIFISLVSNMLKSVLQFINSLT